MKKGFSLYPWDNIDRAEAPFEDGERLLREIADCGFNSSPFVAPRFFNACRKAGLSIRAMFENFNPWKPEESVLVGNHSAEEIEKAVKENVRNLPNDVISYFIVD